MKIGIDIDGVLTNYYEAVIDNATKYFYENKIEYKIDQSKYYENEMFNVSDEDIEHFRYLVEECDEILLTVNSIQELKVILMQH